MKTLLYLLQVSACTGIFYLFYKVVLSRLTFFTLNRWYLLATLLISFVLPHLTISGDAPQPLRMIYKPVIRERVQPVITEVAGQRWDASSLPLNAEPFNWINLFGLVYLVAVTGFTLQLAYAFTRIFLKIRRKSRTAIGTVKIIKDDKRVKNASFLNYIFLNDEDLTAEELRQVLDHELAHIRLVHSADRILARLVQVVLWFNPFSYLYARAIEENHEFEVDQGIAAIADKKGYAELLVRLSVSPESTLYHHFSMIPLKRRIAMLFTQPTQKMKKIMYLLVLPLVVFSGLAFANRTHTDRLATALFNTKKETYSPQAFDKTGIHRLSAPDHFSPVYPVLQNWNLENKLQIRTPELISLENNQAAYIPDSLLHVTVTGEVAKPGTYTIQQGRTVKQIVELAGVVDDTYKSRASLVRNNKAAGQRETIVFNIGEIISGKAQDITLKENDVLNLVGILSLKNAATVSISGDVSHPGVFVYVKDMTLADLLKRAGNLKAGTTAKRIEIARRKNDDNAGGNDVPTADLYAFYIDATLETKAAKFVLQPGDSISTRP